MKLKWSFGNSKLKKSGIVGFTIPAYESKNGFRTCPSAGYCKNFCYARQGLFMMPAIRKAYEFNLTATKSTNQFIIDATDDLNSIKAKIIRIHPGGDFYSQDYLNAWYSIARNHPDKIFYAYTKSLHLDLWTNKPDNVRLIQSVGGLWDHKIDKSKPHSKIFATHYARRKAGYSNGSITDRPAVKGTVRLGLIYHGNRKLKTQQKKFLNRVE